MKLLFISIFILFCPNKGFTQNHKTLIKQTAQILIDATIKEDYSTVINYTYPKIVEASGGKDSLLNIIKGAFKKMKSQGIQLTIIGGSIGDPGEEIKIGTMLYCVIPEKVIMKINGANYMTNGSLIGISSDNGDHWSFADSAGLEKLKAIQPDVNKLAIPANTTPTLMKETQ